jgi:hypothetical protein
VHLGGLVTLIKVQFTTIFGDIGSIIADLAVVVKRYFYAKDWTLSYSPCSDTFLTGLWVFDIHLLLSDKFIDKWQADLQPSAFTGCLDLLHGVTLDLP